MAREIVAIEDDLSDTLKPVPPLGAGDRAGEPVDEEAEFAGGGEVPTITDQGEQEYPPSPNGRENEAPAINICCTLQAINRANQARVWTSCLNPFTLPTLIHPRITSFKNNGTKRQNGPSIPGPFSLRRAFGRRARRLFDVLGTRHSMAAGILATDKSGWASWSSNWAAFCSSPREFVSSWTSAGCRT